MDTAGWVCHFDAAQPQHAAAATFVGVCLAERRRLVTTSYVIAELVSVFTSRRSVTRAQLIACVDAIEGWGEVVRVHIDPALHRQAWDLLKARPDKHWSLVDCASFVVMTQLGLREALTTDHHFEQAGFVRLLMP